MSNYFMAKNENDEFVISDTYSNLTLEEVVNLGDLGAYSTDNEVDGGICNILVYKNESSSDTTGFKYPFFACLGTKRNGKFCVLYNASSSAKPCAVMNAYTGLCRDYTNGTRQAYSYTMRGAKNLTISWQANLTDLRSLYYGKLYPLDFSQNIPLMPIPQCLGTAIQPVAIVCDDNPNHTNLKDYYVFVFGTEKKTAPNANEVGLCCYDANGKIIFSSINHPLVINQYVAGNYVYGETNPISITNQGKKLGVCASMYNSNYIPIMSKNQIDFPTYYNFFMDYPNVKSEYVWRIIYSEFLNNCYFNGTNSYGYAIVDVDNICNYYNI